MFRNVKIVIENLAKRNIEGRYFNNLQEVENALLDAILDDAVVGIGNSQTLKKIGITEKLKSRGNTVYDKTTATNKVESKESSKKALLSDWYISGTNALSKDGHIVNIDHTGNRVAAMIYGPERVIVVIGVNKIED